MLDELRRCLKARTRDKTIFDIVVYGSLVKGKRRPADIDIAVIFRTGRLRERLAKVQDIKKVIKEERIDVKGILLEELFQETFFARSGIFLEGISIFDGRPFAQRIDFAGSSLFSYTMRDKTHSEKVKFNYVLSGRKGAGIVELLEGKHLAPGTIQVPMRQADEFEEVLRKHNITFNRKNILVQR